MDFDSFRSHLEALAYRYHVHHPFDKLLQSGRASREMLRLWAANRYYYQDTIPRKDAAIVAHCPDSAVRGGWVAHVVTHDVDGALGEWLLLTRALGLTDAEVTEHRHLLPATKFACDAYFTFCQRAPWQEGMCASMTHLFAGDIHRTRIAHWPDKYPWLPDEAFTYFRNRVRTLPAEVDYSLRVLSEHFGATPAGLARAEEILRFKQDVLWSMLDALWHHFFAAECRVPAAPALLEDTADGTASSSPPLLLLRILGSGAGGGTPQWNRHDDLNDRARHGCAPRRTQCSAALRCATSASANEWVLVNCSPDVGLQWNELVRAHPGATLHAVLLTDAQLDHVSGLLSLREARGEATPLRVFCTDAVRETLETDLPLLRTLRRHGVEVEVMPLRDGDEPFPSVRVHVLANGKPRYASRESEVLALSLGPTRCYAPCVPRLDPKVVALFAAKKELWLDGTFATADEMPGVSGHVPMSELRAAGAVHWPEATVHFVHVNNTNPETDGCVQDGDCWAV